MTTIRCVSVSGGKDSTACALLALERHPKEEIRLVFADTGNEHEITYDYVNNYMPKTLGLPVHVVRADFTPQIAGKALFVREKWPAMGVPLEKVERALATLRPTGNPFLDLCIWKGRFPSRRAQFCTEQLKKLPLTAYQEELLDEFGEVESWQGIRWDESQNRKNALEREDIGGGILKITAVRPILSWTAQQTVDYVRSKGIELNPLYSQGMGRVGCMPCINARKGEVLEIAKRFPEHVARIAEWEEIVHDASKWDGATFFAMVEDAKGLTTEECVEKGNILQIVEWAKTGHGGKQYDLFSSSTEEAPSCSSAYGLCE